jgi:hypothetical protein
MTGLSSGSGTLAFFGSENGPSRHSLKRSVPVAFAPNFEHHPAMTEPIQENDTHAPSEVRVDLSCQVALPLSPSQLMTDADQVKAWALALGDY